MSGLDLITVGRSSVDLYGQQIGGRLEDMASFAKYVGGSPTNTAIGAQRLGLRTGLVTGVGDDHMGRFILETLQGEGVVTTAIRRDPERLTALVVLGILDKDTFPLIFYRENCADMALVPEDLDLDWLRSTKAVLINGTHLSRDNVYATSRLAAETVKAAGGQVIFDIDYRPVLWGLTNKDQGENRYVSAQEVTLKLRTVAMSAPPARRSSSARLGRRAVSFFQTIPTSRWPCVSRAMRSMSSMCSALATPSPPVSSAAGCAAQTWKSAAAVATRQAPWSFRATAARLPCQRRRNSTCS
jgi:hypothetical protein